MVFIYEDFKVQGRRRPSRRNIGIRCKKNNMFTTDQSLSSYPLNALPQVLREESFSHFLLRFLLVFSTVQGFLRFYESSPNILPFLQIPFPSLLYQYSLTNPRPRGFVARGTGVRWNMFILHHLEMGSTTLRPLQYRRARIPFLFLAEDCENCWSSRVLQTVVEYQFLETFSYLHWLLQS